MEDQKQRVYDALNKLGIKYEVVEHEPVHTMEDMDRSAFRKRVLCAKIFFFGIPKANVTSLSPAMKRKK